MLELEEAVEQILATIPPATPERLPLAQAHGRVLLEQCVSPVDLPLFDNSAMDGYAVRAEDVTDASSESPVGLRPIGRVPTGSAFAGEVPAGACVRLFTGSPLPRGANAVAMQEGTRPDSAQPEVVWFLESVKPGENVRRRGEDVKRGTNLVEAGSRLTAARIALLAAVGVEQVLVGRQPRVGLLATGSELRRAGQSLAPGQIYESNCLGLAPLVRNAGGQPRVLPLVPDTLTATRAALEQAFGECHAVVTSGGVSVGEMDFVKTAFEQLGGTMQFWKVAIKPGRPFVFGRWREKYLFGLPGNPVSAFVTFLLLVRPALARWQGATELAPPTCPGVLAEPLSNPGQRRHFMRVTVNHTGEVRSAGAQASHLLSSLALANGLVDVPPQITLPAGAPVQVISWD